MTVQHPNPGIWQLFRVWAGIGLQSFGGGASTTLLIQQTFIEKHKWMTIEEFVHFWSLSLLAPGINLVALTILIGRKLGGTWGIVASLAGLLLPSATITCLLTALYTQIEHFDAIKAIVRGIVPATGGIMFLVGLNFALPLLRQGYNAGLHVLFISILLIVVSLCAVFFLKLSVVVVILGAMVVGAFLLSPHKPALVESGEIEHD